MCQICAARAPWSIDCPYQNPSDDGPHSAFDNGNELPVFNYDQIADQLTTGYWGGGPYAFNVEPGGSLTVDLAGLTQAGQEAARLALQSWSEVTGINFIEMPNRAASGTVTEGPDASSGTSTAYSMAAGQDFRGTLGGGPDRDAVRIELSAGQKIAIQLEGDDSGGNALADAHLRLRDASGNIILERDDAYGADAVLSFQAPTSGTYYLQAGASADAHEGDYLLSVRNVPLISSITFDDNQSGAFAQFWTSGGSISRSTINIDDNWAGGQPRVDGYFLQTYIHEVGHALGLGHAGPYNGSASYPGNASYQNDSWQASVMSYFDQRENPFIDADFAYVVTPQVADIVAIQDLYGVAEARTGDDVYGANGTTGTYLDGALDLPRDVTFTVYDTGGRDLFDFSGYADDQTLDLREEAFSDLAGVRGNIGIARGTVIEDGKTGSGDDALTGNGAGNGLSAGAGDDSIDGRGGHDALSGGAGRDEAIGRNGRDLIEGGAGDDTIEGGASDDVLIGDDITLDLLIDLFPTWEPPPDAGDLIDQGDLIAVWDDILEDVFLIA